MFFQFQLLSGAVTALMTWILVEKEKEVKNAYDFFLDPACVMCLAGSVAFLVSFFGWWGSLREYIPFLAAVSMLQDYMYTAES